MQGGEVGKVSNKQEKYKLDACTKKSAYQKEPNSSSYVKYTKEIH